MSKRLGQIFLKNKEKISNIVDALDLEDGDTVVEIGPGNGGLTKEMIRREKRVKIIGIEKDKKLVDKLVNSKFVSERDNIEIIEGDALTVLPGLSNKLKSISYKQSLSLRRFEKQTLRTCFPQLPCDKLIGNIPYYITGQLLRILGEMEKKPNLIVLTIQKEVAERLTAEVPKMNILAASVQVWGRVEIIDHISKNDFRPRPAVDSAVIRIIPLGKPVPDKYYQAVKILFQHPRKTVLNNLSAGLKKTKEEISRELERMGVNSKARPQDFKISTIKKISEML